MADHGADSEEARGTAQAPALRDGEEPTGASSSNEEVERDASSAAGGSTAAEEPIAVHVAPLEQLEFDSWDALHAAKYVTASATPRTARNDRLPVGSPLTVPASFQSYNKTLQCRHAGDPRVRGAGVRLRLAVNKIACPARINACVRRVAGGAWKVVVTRHTAVHNHRVAQDKYVNYPDVRTDVPADVLSAARVLLAAGAPRRAVLGYIRSAAACQMTLPDVHNLVARTPADAHAPLETTTVRAYMTGDGGGDAARYIVEKDGDTVSIYRAELQTRVTMKWS